MQQEARMIVRSNSRTARTVLSAGALALAVVIFGFPVSAMPNVTNRQWCMSRCQLGDHGCFQVCNLAFPKKKAAVSPVRRPVTGTGAPSQPTQLHR
jgi:hypothetical protein